MRQLPLNLVLLKNVSVVGIFWGAYTREPACSVTLTILTAPYREGTTAYTFGMESLTGVSSSPQISVGFSDIACSLLASGNVAPVIYTEIYPLEKVADGLRALEGRQTWGKAIVRVREDSAVAKL